MKKRKSALKYFVHLIKFGELEEKRAIFHRQYPREVDYARQIHGDRGARYDKEAETAKYEKMTIDFKFIDVVVDFGQSIRNAVAVESKKAKSIIYDRLTSGLLPEQEALYNQVLRDVEELIGIVAEQLIYTKYPSVAEALCGIRDFATAHQPSQPGTATTRISLPEPVVGQVMSFYYRCFEEGTLKEDRSLARHLLGNLFLELKDRFELIAPDTSIDDFRAIFSGKAVTKRIRWMGVINQLYYFIQAISPRLIPPGQKKLEEKWATAAACFVNREGGAFTKRQLENPGVSIDKVHKGREIGELAKILR